MSIDGVEVRRSARVDPREKVAIVLQQAILISGTIAENVRHGRLTASDAVTERQVFDAPSRLRQAPDDLRHRASARV